MTEHLKLSKTLIMCFAAAAAVSAACAYMCSKILTPAYIEMKLDVVLERSGTIKIFYLGKNDPIWTEQKTLESKMLPAGKSQEISFRIPVRKMSRVRLDYQHPGPGHNEIRNFELNGTKTLTASDMEIPQFYDVRNIQKTDSSVILDAGAYDPHIIFHLKETLNGQQDHDIFLIGIIFSAALMILCIIILGIRKLYKNGNDMTDLFFLSAVFLLLCIPAAKINRAAVSVRENRTLAKFPELISGEGKINTLAGQQFDSWFSDRFFGRDYLVKGYQKTLSAINLLKRNYAVSNSVVEGKDRWFFYRLDNAIRNYQNLDIFTEKELKENLENLKKMNEWCKANNMKFYYYIAPDKHKIYGEYMTFVPKSYPDSRSRAALWVNYIRKHSDIKVIYPLDELKKQKGKDLLYYKSDSHWNKLGGYYGYLELMKFIKKDFPDFRQFSPTAFREETDRIGDLYAFMPHIIGKDTCKYKVPNLPDKYILPLHIVRKHYYSNPEGKYNVFVMRDSFGSDLIQYLHYSCANVTSVWRFALKPEDLSVLKQQKNNIVILLHVERHLPKAMKEIRTKSAFSADKE